MTISNMRRCVLYLRVSTDEQAEDGYSIQIQKERLIAYCKAQGWVIVRIFVDAGWSGSNLKRPGMEELIEYVEGGNCDTVLVHKLDRLSRSQKDTMYLIEDLFIPNDVAFVSMQESFDTSTPFGIAMVGILSVFAQLERENIKSRTFGGRVERAKDGLWHGGGSDPIGYDYIDGELKVNKEEAVQVRMVFELFASGHSFTDIKDIMAGYRTKHGDWHHTETITSVLENELYTGTVHFEDVKTPESHTAIIERSLFDKVQFIRERQKSGGWGARSSKHLLTGLLFCKNCGARYFAKKMPNGNVFYTCHSRAKVNKRMVKDPCCKNKNWPESELDQLVTEKVMELAKNPAMVNQIINEKKTAVVNGGQSSVKPYMEEVGRLDQEINRYMELYQSDQISADIISEKINALYHQKMELLSANAEQEDVEVRSVRDFHVDSVKLLLHEVLTVWSDGSFEYRKKVLSDLIDGIELEQENVQIRWSFV